MVLLTDAPFVDFAKKIVRDISTVQDGILKIRCLLIDQQAFVRAIVIEFIQRVFDLARRCGNPQMVTGNRFQRVRFIEDDHVVVRQDTDPNSPQGQVAKE